MTHFKSNQTWPNNDHLNTFKPSFKIPDETFLEACIDIYVKADQNKPPQKQRKISIATVDNKCIESLPLYA